MASGKIYVIQSGESHYYKIGLTKNITKTRLKALQTGNPYRLYLRLTMEVADMKLAEDILHRRYYEQRGIGEWFYFDPKHRIRPARIEEALFYIQYNLNNEIAVRIKLKEMMI